MYIKKKLIAISAILAIAASFVACSDNGSSSSSGKSAENNSKNEIVAEDVTISSEELDQIIKHDLSIAPFVPKVQQDAVEDGNNNVVGNYVADGNNIEDNNVGGNDGNNNDGGNNNAAGDNNNAAGVNNNAGGNNNAVGGNNSTGGNTSVAQPNGVTNEDIGSNNVDIPSDTGLKVISGTKAVMQAYWMNLSEGKDYIFNGEYLVAQFIIKDDAADGIYPITFERLEFANWDTKIIEFTGIDGAIVVGGEATENKFNDDDTPQIMAANVNGKPGDTVTVPISVKNNPGVIANILRFSYNSDALEYVGGGEGADFNGHFQ